MNYRCETDLAAIKDYLQKAVVVAFDFETAPLLQYRDDPRAALDAHRACIVGISLSVAEGSALYIPLEHFDGGNADSDQVIPFLRDVLWTNPYLSQAYRIDQRINAKLMRISELRALAQKCTVAYGGERVSHTRNVASLEDSVMKIMEAEKELDAQIDLLVDTKKEIEGVIERVPDADCRLLLEMRYLAMKCWIDVAAEMNVCRAYVHRLHEKALGMVETILQERSAGSHE